MVISPLMVLANVATAGTASTASTATKTAIKAAEAAKKGGDAATLKSAVDLMNDGIEKLMLVGESDLAALSTPEIAKAIVAKYPVGTPNNKQIARKWAQVVAAIYGGAFASDVANFAVGAADVTGVVGTIQAYNKPVCGQHTPVP
jgi:hypothetical protein